MIGWMQSTHQRSPCRNANRPSAVSAPEPHTIRRDGVHIRRLQTGMAIYAQTITALSDQS
jgi:hypothetical protein